jgi:hypothetical protein
MVFSIIIIGTHTVGHRGLNFQYDNIHTRMEKISWTDHVRNEEVLLRVNEQRNILHEISKWKANWIGHIWRRNCLNCLLQLVF